MFFGGRRIIPAYAGSTDSLSTEKFRARDHPRIRGEHCTPLSGINNAQGSSPHTRGAPGMPLPTAAAAGIIPAYAGSTTSGATKAKKQPDHPRIRGEHVKPSYM